METKIYMLELEVRYFKKDRYYEKFMQVGTFKNKDEAIKKGNEFIETNLKSKFEIREDDKFTSKPFYNSLVSNCCYKDKVKYYFKIRELETDFNGCIKDIL